MYIFQYLPIYDIIIFVMREQYIEKQLRKNLIKSLVLPLLFFGVLIDALLILNLNEVSKPVKVDNVWDFFTENSNASLKNKYVKVTLNNLEYTGFDLTKSGKRIGSFYYMINNSNCILTLINTSSDKGSTHKTIPSKIKKYQLTGKILKSSSLNNELINNIAKQISWDSKNLKDNISEYVISEPDYKISKVYMLASFIVILLVITLIYIIYKIILLVNPHLLPGFKILNRYGSRDIHIRTANRELSNKVIERLDNAFITENYFIDLSTYKTIIIPLRDIDACKYQNRRKRKSTIKVRMSHGDTYKIYDRTYSDYKKLKNSLVLVSTNN
ncbi:MAG TPA: hypothetical protein DCL29_00775 [Eubacterium sp.]|nr:hypothetical protein [Eubacterium sp.]